MTVQGTGFSMTLATGRQAFCAAIVFVSNYVIALPIAVTLMFATHLELAGIMHLFAHTHTHATAMPYFLPYLVSIIFIAMQCSDTFGLASGSAFFTQMSLISYM